MSFKKIKLDMSIDEALGHLNGWIERVSGFSKYSESESLELEAADRLVKYVTEIREWECESCSTTCGQIFDWSPLGDPPTNMNEPGSPGTFVCQPCEQRLARMLSAVHKALSGS